MGQRQARHATMPLRHLCVSVWTGSDPVIVFAQPLHDFVKVHCHLFRYAGLTSELLPFFQLSGRKSSPFMRAVRLLRLTAGCSLTLRLFVIKLYFDIDLNKVKNGAIFVYNRSVVLCCSVVLYRSLFYRCACYNFQLNCINGIFSTMIFQKIKL